MLELTAILQDVPGALEALGAELRHALEQVGFYYICGHGMALSQILVCRDCEASSPLLVRPLRGESVELFGRTAARFPYGQLTRL